MIAVPVCNDDCLDGLRADAMDEFDDTAPGARLTACVDQDQAVGLFDYGDIANDLDVKTGSLAQHMHMVGDGIGLQKVSGRVVVGSGLGSLAEGGGGACDKEKEAC